MEYADPTATMAALAVLPNGAGSEYAEALDKKLHASFHKMPVYDVRMSEGWDEHCWTEDGRQYVKRHPPYDLGPPQKDPYTSEMVPTILPGERRPRFREVDYVRIMTPGDKENIVDREVRPSDKSRFPKQWAAYVAGHDQDAASGTPLSLLLQTTPPILTSAQVEELKHFKVRTVEQLAGVTDGLAARFMGLQALKRKAANFLESFKADAAKAEIQAQFEKRDSENAVLKARLEELTKVIEEMKGPRGSPLAGKPIAASPGGKP